MEPWRDELYHREHKYVAKIGRGKDAKYFYTQAAYDAYRSATKVGFKDRFTGGNLKAQRDKYGHIADQYSNYAKSLQRSKKRVHNSDNGGSEAFNRYADSMSRRYGHEYAKAKTRYSKTLPGTTEEVLDGAKKSLQRTGRELKNRATAAATNAAEKGKRAAKRALNKAKNKVLDSTVRPVSNAVHKTINKILGRGGGYKTATSSEWLTTTADRKKKVDTYADYTVKKAPKKTGRKAGKFIARDVKIRTGTTTNTTHANTPDVIIQEHQREAPVKIQRKGKVSKKNRKLTNRTKNTQSRKSASSLKLLNP